MSSFMNRLRLAYSLTRNDHRARNGPFYVSVDITRRCNLRCVCCPIHSPLVTGGSGKTDGNPDMTLALFAKLCSDLSAIGTDLLIIEGEGEPFLHPKIFEMTACAKAAGLQVMLFTNGTMLSPANVERLLAAPPDILKVTVWATTPEEFQENYPGTNPDGLQHLAESLGRLAQRKNRNGNGLPWIEICHPINRINQGSISRIVDWAGMSGADSIRFTPVHIKAEALAPYGLSASEESSLGIELGNLAKRLGKRGLRHNIGELLRRYRQGEKGWQNQPCYVGWYHARVKEDGEVLACFWYERSMGRIPDQSFSEIWNGAGFRNFRAQTRTVGGAIGLEPACDCNWCSHGGDNERVHRVARWLPRLTRGSIKGDRDP